MAGNAVFLLSGGIMGNFGNKWNKFVQIFIEKNGYVKVVQGLQNTLLIAVVGMLIGVLIGTIIATVRVLPKYRTLPRALNAVCSFYVGLFRGTPMVVQLLIFYYVMLPLMGIKLPGVRVAMVVSGLNSGAYISEIMRSGIQSVDPGQLEAGRAGLGFGPAMIRIVIPQAVKNILPTLGNEFIALIKETSVVSTGNRRGGSTLPSTSPGKHSYEFMVPYLVMAAIYIVLVLVISILVKLMERSLKKSDRRH